MNGDAKRTTVSIVRVAMMRGLRQASPGYSDPTPPVHPRSASEIVASTKAAQGVETPEARFRKFERRWRVSDTAQPYPPNQRNADVAPNRGISKACGSFNFR